jgi:hypothetical protein
MWSVARELEKREGGSKMAIGTDELQERLAKSAKKRAEKVAVAHQERADLRWEAAPRNNVQYVHVRLLSRDGCSVSPFGGVTIAIESPPTPSEHSLCRRYGVGICSLSDQFSRAVGRKYANRMLKHGAITTTLPVKTAQSTGHAPRSKQDVTIEATEMSFALLMASYYICMIGTPFAKEYTQLLLYAASPKEQKARKLAQKVQALTPLVMAVVQKFAPELLKK